LYLGLKKKFSALILWVAFFASPTSAFSYEDELPLSEPEHKLDLATYTERFCRSRGKPRVRVQGNVVVDCLTNETLWKIDYADNWQSALVQSLKYAIYDDYRGEPEYAPTPGVVLIQEDSDDFKNSLELQQIVKHYQLPVKIEVIENYASASTNSPAQKIKSKFLKNFDIDLGL
jgi:hypothetical protein